MVSLTSWLSLGAIGRLSLRAALGLCILLGIGLLRVTGRKIEEGRVRRRWAIGIGRIGIEAAF